MTTINNATLELDNISTQIVTVKGTPAAVLAVGSLLMFDNTDGTFITYANGSNPPVAVVKTALTIPAGGSLSAEVIFTGNLNEALVDLPGSMTLDSIPTVDGLAASSVGAAGAGNTGDGVITATPTVGTKAQTGVYRITCINADVAGSEVFSVFAPNGERLADAVTGVAYLNSHIGFTITKPSGYDPDVADTFTVIIAGIKMAKSLRQYLREVGIFFKALINIYE
jgi:hypothetical protein